MKMVIKVLRFLHKHNRIKYQLYVQTSEWKASQGLTPKSIDNRLMYMDDEDNTDEQDDDADDEEETIPKVKPKVMNKNIKF
ncbi:MAG: hypothetical protein EZS28_037351 [Streblomastix strix]|uniref:Uncharacterized protein n=1 Tax=Streblomastix strix TaxID=222440 RepID=A0A5J4UB37_9EUKA|nr:MAG: hypothetical protein EZS28_037351 [Streblomastix strix]